MNRKLLIDYDEVRKLFNKKFKETMQLIKDGEAHLDNLAEGFTEADRVLFKLLFLSPQTNADRIRAMSDEELAELFHATILGWTEWCDHHCANWGDDNCGKCVLDWLKQPARGGDNDG